MPKTLYDQVNKKNVTTTPIPGEEAIEPVVKTIPFRLSNIEGSTEALRYDNNIDRVRTQTADESTEYEIGSDIDADLAQIRAERQSNWEKAYNATVGGTIDGLGTYLEDVGYMFDVGDHYDRLTGGAIDKDNWLSNIGRDIKDWSADALPVYETALSEDAGFTEQFFKWSTWRSALDSMVGYGLAGVTAGGVTKALGTALQTANPWLAVMAKQSPKTAKFLQNASPAVLTNIGEGKTMALEVYEEQMSEYEPLIASGAMTEEDAIKNASEAANEFQLMNLIFVGADYMGFKNIVNAGVKLTKPGLKSLPKRLASQGVKEYFEETGQKVGQGLVSSSKFMEAEKEFGLWEGAGAFNYGLSPENNMQLFYEHMGNYYQTKEGKAYEKQAREQAKGDEDKMYDLMTNHFTEVASKERLLNSNSDSLLERSVDIFTDPATQVEGAIGFFSSMGQWAITRAPNYKNELKDAKQQYTRQQSFLDKSKELITTRMEDLETLEKLNEDINNSALYDQNNTDDNIDEETNIDDETKAAMEEALSEDEGTKLEDANIKAAWGQMIYQSFNLGVEKQLRNLVEEESQSQDEVVAKKSKELLKDFDDVSSIIKDSQRYYNAGEVGNLGLQVRGYNAIKKTKEFNGLPDGKKEEVNANLKKAEADLKTAKSYPVQKELLMKERKFASDKRKLNKAVNQKNTNALYNLINDKTVDERIKGAAMMGVVANSKGNEHAPEKEVKKDKDGKTEILTDFEAKQQAEIDRRNEIAQEKSGKDLMAVDNDIAKATKKLEGLQKIKDKTDKVLDLITEQENKIKELDNRKKAIVDVSNELKDLSGSEYSKTFKKALEDRISGKTTQKSFDKKFTKDMAETVSKNAGDIGDDARVVIDNYNNATIGNVLGVANSTDALFTKLGKSDNGTLTKTSLEGKTLYRIDTKDSSVTFSEDDFSKGVVSVANGVEGYDDGQIIYTFKMTDGSQISITNTKMLDEISVRIHDAILNDSKEDVVLTTKPSSLYNVLKDIKHPLAKAMVNTFEKRLKSATIEVDPKLKMNGSVRGTAVRINKDFYDNGDRNAIIKTILHEAIHVLTSKLLNDRNNLTKEQLGVVNQILAYRTKVINSLTKKEKQEYNDVVNWFKSIKTKPSNVSEGEEMVDEGLNDKVMALRKSGEFQKYYALINDKEFLAVVSTDERTQEFIDEKLGKADGMSAIKELVRQLLELLGLDNRSSGDVVALMFDTAIIQDSLTYTADNQTDTKSDFDRYVSDSDKSILEKGSEVVEGDINGWTEEFITALLVNENYLEMGSPYYYNLKTVKNFYDILDNRLNNSFIGRIVTFKYTDKQYKDKLKEYEGDFLEVYRLMVVSDGLNYKEKGTSGIIAALNLALNNEKDTKDPVTEKTQDEKNRLIEAGAVVTVGLFNKRKTKPAKRKQLVELLTILFDNDVMAETTSDILNTIYDYLGDEDKLKLSNNYVTFSNLLHQASNEIGKPLILDTQDFNEAANITEPTVDDELANIVSVDAIDIHKGETQQALINLKDTSKDQEVVKEGNLIVRIGRKAKDGFDKIAHLSRLYIRNSKPGFGNSEIISYSDLNTSTIWSDVLSRSVKVGDKITLSVDSEYNGTITFDNKSMPYSEFLKKTKGNDELRRKYVPIRIMKGDSLLGYLHVGEWMTNEKIWGDTVDNRNKVDAIRSYVIDNGTTETTITEKSAGILFMISDKNTVAADAVGEDVEFYVGGNNNELHRKPGKKDKTQTKKTPGVTYMKLPLTSEHSVYVSVTNRDLNPQQLRTINRVFDLLISKNKEDALYKAAYNELGQDITTPVGARNFLKKYIRFAEIPNKLKTGKEIDNYAKKVISQATAFNKPISTFNSDGQLLSSKQFTEDNPFRIQIDAALLGTESFKALEVVVDEKGVETIVDVNEERSYDMFVRDNVNTNFGSYAHTKEDGTTEWIYSYQNVTGFATNFIIDEGKKAITEGARGEVGPNNETTKELTEQQTEGRPNIEEQEGSDEFEDDSIDFRVGEDLKKKCK